MNELSKKALKHFGMWLGLPFTQAEKTLRPYTTQLSIELNRLASALYFPPGADSKTRALQTATADRGLWRMAKRIGVRPKAFWPNGRPYAVCVSHDIDRIFSSVHALKNLTRAPGRTLKSLVHDLRSTFSPHRHKENPFFNFDRMMSLEAGWGIPSTVYVLFEKRRPFFALRNLELQHVLGVYTPKTLQDKLRMYQNLGNEVGLHASFDSWRDKEALERELEALKGLGVREVRGVRNHYLNFDRGFTESIMPQSGILYDSTMGFNFANGFRCGTSFPFRMGHLWELPFQLMDSSLRAQYPDRNEAKQTCSTIQDEVRRQGGVLVLNWHFRVMNADHAPEEIEVLHQMVDQGIRDGAWFTTPAELIRQWEYRTFEDVKLGETEKPATQPSALLL
ncbi:MAG: hypothetical protein H6617_00110 [Bdellovibrionaceae bacterium]|nr:hypothetical protein [Pseudobdellovibrionaceae bacterium]